LKYIEIQVLTTTEASEAVWNILDEEGAAGVLIEDPNDFKNLNKDETRWDYVEQEFIDSLGTDAKVKAYFSEFEYNEGILKNIQIRVNQLKGFGLDPGKGSLSIKEVSDEEWANGWKKYYKPTKVGDRIVIKPTWEEYSSQKDEIIVNLDPGMAFGTGTHETTMLCVKLLEKYVKSSKIVFDVGCGSGILGVCAAKLGAEKVICVDIDEVACKVAKENAELNRVDDIVEVRAGNLLDVVNKKADVIVANIIADVIIGFTDDAHKFMNANAVFISSGIILDRRDDVINKLNESGYKVLEVLELGEWCAIAAERGYNAQIFCK